MEINVVIAAAINSALNSNRTQAPVILPVIMLYNTIIHNMHLFFTVM